VLVVDPTEVVLLAEFGGSFFTEIDILRRDRDSAFVPQLEPGVVVDVVAGEGEHRRLAALHADAHAAVAEDRVADDTGGTNSSILAVAPIEV